MKNLLNIIFLAFAFFAFNTLQAQDFAAVDMEKTTISHGGDVEILKNFKATKAQKKEIKKVRSYVTPKIVDSKARNNALDGKSVKLQLALTADGTIDYITVVEGFVPKLDEKVVALVKEYNEKNPFAQSDIEKPSVIQMEIPLASKAYYGR